MNALRLMSAATLLASSFVVTACSDENDDGAGDAGAGDVVTVDMGSPTDDAGILALCPEPGNFADGVPECTQAMDCQDDIAAQSNCAFCRSYNRSLCTLGRCESPIPLPLAEAIDLRLSIVGFEAEIQSFAGIAVSTETTGGNEISCDNVYASTWDLTETCYNWVDSRLIQRGGEPAQAYPIPFTRLPTDRRVLLLVYGFAAQNAEGSPVGVSCTELLVPSVGAPDTERQVTGDNMQRIQ